MDSILSRNRTSTEPGAIQAVSEAKLVKANSRVELLEELVAAQGKVLGLHAKNAGSPHLG